MNQLRQWVEAFVCPTRVGMNLDRASFRRALSMRLPHTRGDEPGMRESQISCTLRLPHTHGDEPAWPISGAMVLSCLPHTRGDEPRKSAGLRDSSTLCPTRVWMNRCNRPRCRTGSVVCPTRVGMNRSSAAPG